MSDFPKWKIYFDIKYCDKICDVEKEAKTFSPLKSIHRQHSRWWCFDSTKWPFVVFVSFLFALKFGLTCVCVNCTKERTEVRASEMYISCLKLFVWSHSYSIWFLLLFHYMPIIVSSHSFCTNDHSLSSSHLYSEECDSFVWYYFSFWCAYNSHVNEFTELSIIWFWIAYILKWPWISWFEMVCCALSSAESVFRNFLFRNN